MRLGAPLTSHIAPFAICCCLAAGFLRMLVVAPGWRSLWLSERTSLEGSLLVPRFVRLPDIWIEPPRR